MKAVRFREFAVVPELTDVPLPACTPTSAIVRVRATGLCRSDWHGWMGHSSDFVLPHVPGHEFSGVIESVGSSVTGWKPGDRVTAPFVCACGHCEQCLQGNQQVCDNQVQPGFTQWGSFAEFVRVDAADTNLVAVPEELSFVAAAALGCRFATAYRAVVSQGRVEQGDWVAVHGCGGVGLSAVMIARAAGARVVAIDVSPHALARATALGATALSSEADVPAAIRELTGGGAQLSLDAFGSRVTSDNSIRCLGKRGRHVQVGLMVGDNALARVPMDLVIANELEILGSHGMAAHAYPAMLAHIANGEIDPRALVGRTISLSDAPEALAAMGSNSLPGMTVIEIP